MLILVTLFRHVHILLAEPTFCDLKCRITAVLCFVGPDIESQIVGIIWSDKHDRSSEILIRTLRCAAPYGQTSVFSSRHDLCSSHAVFCALGSAACTTLQRCRLQASTLAGNLVIVHASVASVERIADLCPGSCLRIVASRHWHQGPRSIMPVYGVLSKDYRCGSLAFYTARGHPVLDALLRWKQKCGYNSQDFTKTMHIRCRLAKLQPP